MYKIVRYYTGPLVGDRHQSYKRTIATGLTFEEAQAHCRNPETSSTTATGPRARRRTRTKGAWFDGYTET